ncbi:MAG: 2Fe-2S iron-sulfur cluster-binding protein [Adhaeribacter sp.]
MPKLVLQNLYQKEVLVMPGQKILTAIGAAGVDWMHACGGKGRCTTCRIIILAGMEGLGELTPPEIKYREQERLKANERLTCQCTLQTDAVGRVPEETKFPHQSYSG